MSAADLPRRAAASKRWRWKRGISVRPMDGTSEPCTVTGIRDDGDGTLTLMLAENDKGQSGFWRAEACVLDLDDPCTLGWLQHLACEAWGDPDIYATDTGNAHGGPHWIVWSPKRGPLASGPTRRSALVASLESAP